MGHRELISGSRLRIVLVSDFAAKFVESFVFIILTDGFVQFLDSLLIFLGIPQIIQNQLLHVLLYPRFGLFFTHVILNHEQTFPINQLNFLLSGL